MKFSYQWLGELVPGLDTDPAELQRLITMKTAECEGIEPAGAHFATVVAARVLTIDPLPKGKNKSVVIDVGGAKQATVVCGASNVRVGQIAPWIPPGTFLDGREIGRALIEGVESEGMLASPAELGINRDHSGLLELEGIESGQGLPHLAPDWIIEIDNKSLTHRPDLWGHFGMAREVAAITRRSLRDPVNPNDLPRGEQQIAVEIEDFSLCPRYSALVVENIQIGPSPLWLQARLESLGLNPINNIVDLTNFILAELPQPMHAFDADKLAGKKIIVRRAHAGERIAALNGETYELDPADLAIADVSGPVAIAGVIGGADSAISESTTRVVFESANFQAASVRLTSARHKLRTDASMRFEKSLDPENTVRGLARAVALLKELCPGARVIGGITDTCAAIALPKPVLLPIQFVVRKLGISVTQERVCGILNALGFATAETSPGVLTVNIPTWRATKDISLKDDLVEEIGRMVGYGEIAPSAPLIASVVPPADPLRIYLRGIRAQLSAAGFTEVYNYSFVNEEDVARFGFEIAGHLAVRNPIASELTHLRRSLLPGLFKNIVSNVRHYREFRIFEIGHEIHPQSGGALPNEITHGAAVIYSAHEDEPDFFELKHVVESLFPGARLSTAAPKSYEHPTRTAEIQWMGTALGRIFQLHPSLLQTEGIEGAVILFDVDLAQAHALDAARAIKYTPLRKYPTSGFDLSIIASLRVPAENVQDLLVKLAVGDLASIEFVRQYAGPQVPEGTKSVSYHLEVGALDRTLTADEVTAIRNRIISGMRENGFDLRV